MQGCLHCFFVLYCQSLSSIHEKANCIVIFEWDVRTCLRVAIFKASGAPVFHINTGALSALPKDTTSELSGLVSTTSLNAERQAVKLWITFFKVFWYDSTWGINPRYVYRLQSRHSKQIYTNWLESLLRSRS